jgi:hypothetical protein
MAQLLYNTLHSTGQFPRAAMVELALEGSSNEQLHTHLVQLLEALGKEKPKGSNKQLLKSLADLVQQDKVLLLLDNVNHDSQLDGLLPPVVFSSGSRVIITSRSEALNGSVTYKVGGAVQNGLAVALHRRCLAYLKRLPPLYSCATMAVRVL